VRGVAFGGVLEEEGEGEVSSLGPTELAELKDLAVDGLLTDGAHHKQWFLEQILIKIGVNLKRLRRELNKEHYDWEEGIAP
jgi:hypothetical protein